MGTTGKKPRARIAYLFIAHNNAEQLARAIRRLDTGNARFFVHVDLKADLATFQDALTKVSNRVVFAEKRISIQWMGYGMVAATLELMGLARQFNGKEAEPFDYQVLLSGADYPLMAGGEIEEILASSGPVNFLMYWNLNDLPDWLHKVEQFHYLDSSLHNQRSGPLLGRFRLPFYQIERWRKRVHRLIPKRRMPLGMIPFGGSQWWMLTSAAVAHILDLLEANPGIERFFRFTHSPDELFFQTILMNSPLRDTVKGYGDYPAFISAWKGGNNPDYVTDQVQQSNLRYIDWDPTREFPSLLDGRDFGRMISSGCLFARKFDPQRSAELMDRLDQTAKDGSIPS